MALIHSATAADDRVHMLDLNFEELSGQMDVVREELCTVTKQVARFVRSHYARQFGSGLLTSMRLWWQRDLSCKDVVACRATIDDLQRQMASKDQRVEELTIDLQEACARLAKLNIGQEDLRSLHSRERNQVRNA
jgi:hypothetical protein